MFLNAREMTFYGTVIFAIRLSKLKDSEFIMKLLKT